METRKELFQKRKEIKDEIRKLKGLLDENAKQIIDALPFHVNDKVRFKGKVWASSMKEDTAVWIERIVLVEYNEDIFDIYVNLPKKDGGRSKSSINVFGIAADNVIVVERHGENNEVQPQE